MDTFLELTWRSGTPPLDGYTLAPDDLLPIDQLSVALDEVLKCLIAVPRVARADVNELADWHEHDGYITSSRPTTWEKMEAFASSPSALYAGREPDEYVRRAYYDKAGSFLLRVWTPDEDDDPDMYPGRWGHFDISAPMPCPSIVKEKLVGLSLSISLARGYFDKCYAG